MTPDLQDLLVATLAAAQRDASAETVARFCVAYARYRAEHPEEGDRAFFDHARASGFAPVLDGPAGPTSLQHVVAALQVALAKCTRPKGGKRRPRGEPRAL